NMLAIECSKPSATNAAIGGTIATTLSTTLRPAAAIQIARQTSTVHSAPRTKATSHGSAAFAAATSIALRATRPSPSRGVSARSTSAARPAAPTRLPRQTRHQLRSSSPVPTLPSAQAIASRLLPVNSSAPATTTMISPSEKRSEEHTSELQSRENLVCRLLLVKKKAEEQTALTKT